MGFEFKVSGFGASGSGRGFFKGFLRLRFRALGFSVQGLGLRVSMSSSFCKDAKCKELCFQRHQSLAMILVRRARSHLPFSGLYLIGCSRTRHTVSGFPIVASIYSSFGLLGHRGS